MTSNDSVLRVGVVGASPAHSRDGRDRWAMRAHLPALSRMPEFTVAAVATTRMESAREAAAMFGVPQAFDSVESMLATADIDAVCVSLPPHLHAEVSLAALQAGKHVYCEQPMATGTADAERMSAVAAEHGLRTVVGHRNAHVPAVLTMAHLVADGYIGEPLTFQHSSFVSSYIQPRPRHRAWLFDAKAGRPAYRSAGSFDRVMSVVGRRVVSVAADIQTRVTERRAVDDGELIHGDQPDNMCYLVRLEGGVTGSVQVSKTAWFGEKERFDVYGTEGMLRLTSVNPQRSSSDDPKKYTSGGLRLLGARADVGDLVERAVRPESIGHPEPMPSLEQFHLAPTLDPDQEPFIVGQAWQLLRRAVLDGEECRANFHEGYYLHRVLDAAESAASQGTWVEVPTLAASIR